MISSIIALVIITTSGFTVVTAFTALRAARRRARQAALREGSPIPESSVPRLHPYRDGTESNGDIDTSVQDSLEMLYKLAISDASDKRQGRVVLTLNVHADGNLALTLYGANTFTANADDLPTLFVACHEELDRVFQKRLAQNADAAAKLDAQSAELRRLFHK